MALQTLQLLAAKNNGRVPIPETKRLLAAALNDLGEALPEREILGILARGIEAWDEPTAWRVRQLAVHLEEAANLEQAIMQAIFS
jgi:hypothetical protein